MRKMAMTVLSLLLTGALLAAQEKPVYSGPTMAGELNAGFVDANLLSNPFVEAIPGFASSFTASSFEIRFSSTLSRPSVAAASYKGLVTSSTQMGYELCLAVDFMDTYTFSSATSDITVDAESSGYSLLQEMIDWYDANRLRYGLASNPFGSAWPSTAYGSETGRYRFIVGERVEPIGWVTWSDEKWADARALYTDMKKAILDSIEAISTDVNSGSGNHINQYTYAALSDVRKALVLKEQEAYDRFLSEVFGEDSSFSIYGLRFRKAYLAVTNLAGFLDARLDFAGSRLSVGSLVASPRAGQDDSGTALRLGLATGLVQGLSLSMAGNFAGGIPSTAEDYDTYTMEYDPGESAWFGLGIDAAYDLSRFLPAGKFVLRLDLLAPDLAERPLTLAASLAAAYRVDGNLSLDLEAELDGLLWDERFVDDASTLGLAAALDLSADYMGIGARLAAAWKTAGYGGYGGNSLQDQFAGFSAHSDFTSAAAGNAAMADLGFSYAPAAMTGLDLGYVKAGANVFLYGDSMAFLGLGWYGDLCLRLLDLCGIPLEIELGYYRYSNSDNGGYLDAGNWPVAGFLDDSGISASIAWNITDDIELTLGARDYDSGWKLDTGRVLEVSAFTTVSF